MKNTVRILAMPSLEALDEIIEHFTFPVDVTRASLKELVFSIKDNRLRILHKGVDIAEYDFVWLRSNWGVRDLGYAVTLYLEKHNVPVTISEKTTSKVTDHVIFSLKNIPSPNTLHFNVEEVSNNIEIIKDVCNFPVVIKDIRGLGGMNSSLVFSEAELYEKITSLPKHRRFILQQFIENDYDWGVMVSDGQVVSGEKSFAAQGEFRNNACHGSKEVFVPVEEIPEEIKEMAIRSSQALGLEWSRADIIIDKKTESPYLLEVNRAPGVTSKSDEVTAAYQFLSSQVLSAEQASKVVS